MPDPIRSSSLSSDPFTPVCGFDSEPQLTSQGALGAPLPHASADAAPDGSRPAADLVQKFKLVDHSVLISASCPSGSPRCAPPPALTVKAWDIEFHTGIPRLQSEAELGGLHLTAAIDVLNVNAHIGTQNEDGSQGAHVGWGANLLNGELTVDYHGWSLSVGAGESLGGSIASGDGRDMDGDAAPEHCFKMTLGPFTLGECDEL